MKKAMVLLAVLVLLVGVVVPSEAWARGFRGGFHHGCCWGWWWPGAVIGGLALGTAIAASQSYAYAPPPVVYQPAPVYVSAPSYAAQAYAAPAAPAVQREVVYPNGRYVLYGDGVSQPWQWVWVPAAPPPPDRVIV